MIFKQKFFNFLALLMFASGAHALTEGVSYQCPDGRYVVDTGTPDCPTNVTGATAGDALADTTTNIQATLDQTGGTNYWCVYPSGNADPDFDQLVAGTDGTDSACTDSGNGSAASTAFTDSVTGLTAATGYKTAVANLSASGKRSQVSVSAQFTTLAGGGTGGDDLTGLGTFVGCGVGSSDSNTGTSHAQRLASLPENMAVGANVYLQAGCVWEDVDWRLTVGGTSGDRQEINAYCIDTSDSDKPKAWTDGGVGCTAKPEINGTYAPSCGAATGNGSGCEFALNGTNSSAVPTSQHNGIVHLVRAQYVTIENIAIHDSAGNGLQIDEGYDTPSHFIGRGLEFEHILKRAILVARAVEDGNAFFDDITINQASLQIPDGLGGTWSACVSFNSNDATINSGIVMQNTTMTNCGAEGYSTLSIGGVVFRDSYSANSMRVAWFPDASQNVVFERMTAVMSPHPLRPDFKPELFATAVECYGPSLTYDSTGHILRDSVAYNVSGEANFIRVAIEGNAGCPEPHRSNGYDPRTEGFKVGVKVFNTTFFAADTTVFAIKCTICTSDPGAIEMKGNVFVGTSRVQNAEADWDMDYNYWDTAPSDSDASGANDVVGGSGFSNDNSWDADDPPTISDATPGLGSTVLDAGTPPTGSVLDITNYDNWSEFSGGCLLTEAQWEQESYADINCTPRDGATPNMGAVGP